MSGQPVMATLYIVHDPMCSWCWAFSPVRARLEGRLPEEIGVVRLVGGLAPDSDEPMPLEMRGYLQETWREIQRRVPGTPFNFDFWRTCAPRRSTYPACRAVIAARSQGEFFDPAMTSAIQRAYYTRALNPSDDGTLILLARELGLDVPAFAQVLDSDETRARLHEEIARARAMGADSFPSLVLETANGMTWIPLDYLDEQPMLDAIMQAMGREDVRD